MTKNNMMNVVVRSSKQQISKILRSQIMSSLQYLIRYESDRIHDTAAYQILTSNAHSHERISGWESDQFAFRFEYGRHHGSVRVSYMNSDGLQSAIYSAAEWDCFTSFIRSDIDRQIEDQREKNKREEEVRKQHEFNQAVREQVELILNERQQEELKEADRRFKEKINNLQSANDDDELY